MARTINFNGYAVDNNKYEHRVLAEKALGRKLPRASSVHHLNGIRNDNRPTNLVLCPDLAYHRILDKRSRAYYACGNVDWLKCKFCKRYDKPENMRRGSHAKCYADYEYERIRKKGFVPKRIIERRSY